MELLSLIFRNPILYIPYFAIIFAVAIFFLSHLHRTFETTSLKNFNNQLLRISEPLIPKIRLIIIVLGLIWIAFIYYSVNSQNLGLAKTFEQLIRLYGRTALFLFYIVLTPGLLRIFFPNFGLSELVITARRSLGLILFLSALIHASLAFYHYFSSSFYNFTNQPIVTDQIASYLGLTALIVLFLMALTSSNQAVHWLSFKKWKRLHRLIYIISLMVLMHAFLRGTNYQNHATFLPQLVAFLSLFYVLLEIMATSLELEKSTRSKLKNSVYFLGLSLIGIAAIFSTAYLL